MSHLEMHVLAEGRWLSPAGRMVTLGMGWKPSSEAGSAGEPEKTMEHSMSWAVRLYVQYGPRPRGPN